MKLLLTPCLIIAILIFAVGCTKYAVNPDDALEFYLHNQKIRVSHYNILAKEKIDTNTFLILYLRDNYLIAHKFYKNNRNMIADKNIEGGIQLQNNEPVEYFVTSGIVNNKNYTAVVGVVNSDEIKTTKVYKKKDGNWKEIASSVYKTFIVVDYSHNVEYKILGYDHRGQVIFENP
ncbi:hypothetical protein P378_19340 [Desulforamulus profundi]|uniref:Lipoprotein n=1 Tax=Desulforamulus profundi TaxID=1383067 RepID=A0A2C6L1G7_9FIRM|nr:hypothetical protein [Desulforamulus profundi]PHJ36941.1 hypothetical protein P378_19340 [Desulforamulus profundi]